MTRSNRQLTQFAVRKIQEFIDQGPSAFRSEGRGNTAVARTETGLNVTLFDKVILQLTPESITVCSGQFYDSYGRPSRTTRERLNGILDALGELSFIPEGVRAFINKDTGECLVGKAEEARLLGKDSNTVIILTNPSQLVFE